MVNERLIHFLEKNNILSKFQAGFRTQRSTIDQLVRLETYIKDALAKGEHAIAIFFDLKKAYDTTWKYGIIIDSFHISGNVPSVHSLFTSVEGYKGRRLEDVSIIRNEYCHRR